MQKKTEKYDDNAFKTVSYSAVLAGWEFVV